ncbi:hypothetical protein GT23_1581 [Parageobacillus thermoglucosidasius]|nr:hypothetical protein GT23_1581 [Parageobacillus thermoglucosidasius]
MRKSTAFLAPAGKRPIFPASADFQHHQHHFLLKALFTFA